MSLARFEEELLRSAPGDGPSEERTKASRERVMRAAGFATAALTAPAIASTTSAKAAGVATTSAKWITITKLLAVTVLATGVSAAVITRPLSSAPIDPASAKSPTPTRTAAPSPPAPPTPQESDAPPSVADVPPPVAPVSTPVPRVSSRSAAAKRSAPDPLAVEATLLEGARTCLEAGDLACATTKLDEHDSQFPRGSLADEAAIVRIELARKRGDVASARRLAERLLRSSPSGPYAPRARAVLGEPDVVAPSRDVPR